MPTIANSEQSAHWNGTEGDFWVKHDDHWDAVNSGFNEVLFQAAAIGEQDTVLDVGCGNGQTVRMAARTARGGRVIGLDISEQMLERTRVLARAEGLTNVTVEHGDAQVFPFQENTFDVVISRFGLTFFDDPEAALANIARAMRPGARLSSINVGDLGRSDWPPIFAAIMEVVALPWVMEPKDRNPLADPEKIGDVLAGAGFKNISLPHMEVSRSWGRNVDDAVGFILAWTPIRESLTEVDAETVGQVRAALAKALQPYATSDGVYLRTPAWHVTANLG